jgi:hypothetical protein
MGEPPPAAAKAEKSDGKGFRTAAQSVGIYPALDRRRTAFGTQSVMRDA